MTVARVAVTTTTSVARAVATKPIRNMGNFKTILCGLYALAAIAFAAGVSAQPITYTHNGTTLKLREVEVNIGIEKPFSVLHISDSHLAYADERDDARKNSR